MRIFRLDVIDEVLGVGGGDWEGIGIGIYLDFSSSAGEAGCRWAGFGTVGERGGHYCYYYSYSPWRGVVSE